MKRLLPFVLTAVASASSVPFDDSTDLSAYSVATVANGSLTQASSYGAGNPVTGGLRYQGDATANERGAIARKALAAAFTDGIWTTSILINAREMDSSSADKAEVRIGFAAADTVPAKPWEYFNKGNDSISVKFKAEHKPIDGKTRNLECELTNRVTTEASSARLTLNNSADFDNWLRLTLKLTRSGNNGFAASYTLENLGADGTSSPVVIFDSGNAALTNANLASATTLYEGFSPKTEKSKTTSVYLDDHSTSIEAVAPTSPAALAPVSVAAQAVTAAWSPATTGVPASTYVLELTTAADAFSPNTFIAANGATGQASGIAVPAPASSGSVTGLLPDTDYLYRVRAANAVGTSEPSSVISFHTPTLETNAPPTLDAINDVGPVSPSQGTVSLDLTGISAGGEAGQAVTVSAVSSHPGIVAPVVAYASPDATGLLTLHLGGAEGSATITVTADDGRPQNHATVRSFTVTVRTPPLMLDFESASDLEELEVGLNADVTHTWFSGAGIGSPAGNGIIVTSGAVTSGDRGFAAWRDQGLWKANASLLRTSVLVNPSQVDDFASGESKMELRVGFTPSTILPDGSKPAEFLNKLNQAISVVLKGEHSPADPSKVRKLEAEIGNNYGAVEEAKAGKLTLLNSSSVNNWLRVTLTLIPAGGDNFNASYTVEDLGEFGDSPPTTILQAGPFPFTNAAMGSAEELYAAYSGKMDKQFTYLRLDEHRASVETSPPSAPQALASTRITASSFQVNWQASGEIPPNGWILEVVPDGSPFTAGNFISQSGASGQAAGIVLTDYALRSLRVSGLSSATAYRWRVIGTNFNGASAPSAEITATTLAAGQNAAPTLDAIPHPAPIAINGAQQTIPLTGISSGGEDGQTLVVSAVSSNPGLIPTPSVSYVSPSETGSLTLTPAPDTVGNAVITVTVNDGGSGNPLVQRSFTVVVVDPEPVIDFNEASDLTTVGITTANASLVHAPASGGSGSGAIAFAGSGSNDRVAYVVRPTAFDAASASYMLASLDFNAADVLDISAGKDKGEIRLGFLGSSTPNGTSLKDTMNKTHPSLGVKFSIEEDLSSPAEKHRKLEGELFSWNGSTETKASKITLTNVANADHWFRVTLLAVRSGTSQFALSYVVDDMGADGSALVSRVIESVPASFAAASLASDNSVFSAFTFTDEKAGTSTLLADRFESVVNTTAPHAPATQVASNISNDSFTANWTAPLTGNWAEGFIVEVVPAGAPFLPGYFIAEDGSPGQTAGILVENPFAEDLTIYGLNRVASYRVRVRAFGEGPEYDESAALNGITVTTLYGPGLEFDDWQTDVFGGNASNSTIAGPNADPDHDGVVNLLEYALGLDSLVSDAHRLPQADMSGPYLRMTYKRRHNVTGVTYQAAATGDLSTWRPEQTVEVSVSTPDEGGMETVVVEDLYPKTLNPRRFLRVGVSQPE